MPIMQWSNYEDKKSKKVVTVLPAFWCLYVATRKVYTYEATMRHSRAMEHTVLYIEPLTHLEA